MTNSCNRVKVPGKLMIAGEYAVLEPKQKCVVAAINRYITTYIEPCRQNKLSLPQLGLQNVTWEIDDGRVQAGVPDPRLNFILNSISVVKQFLQEKSVMLHPFHLKIESELEDPATGIKYGLGSSAAVVVALIFSLLHFHSLINELPQLDQIFKLSAIAHLQTQKSGSGADIAAAVYGGWLEYSAFDAKWILNQLNSDKKLTDIIEKQWPNLSVRRLTAPSSLQLAVGWTKEAVATAPMIEIVQNFRNRNSEAYNKFLRESSIAVARLIRSFETNNCAEAIISLAKNRKVLQDLGENAGVTIETEKLNALCSIAEAFGSSKSSGAGGGDCGIAFIEGESYIRNLYKAWEEADITPLDLGISEIGVSVLT